ncbi:ABC-type dipeptide/oligopeptide/nickel transport system permease subunit [Mycoplana sp. BE70]|uniref:ABC transporter permease n=1 Tax=Mycoplana sp. BE70 TaxID=2817775 RepID=UPI00285E5B40|nr:ABC transporter permease [Mycoplana sp. BE70]MDR6759288.1 ABC-type dipeptide/oligopeptide/nickel transport system permease subunit [Mycoplana sp. BE70]
MTLSEDSTFYRVVSSPGGALSTLFLVTVIFVAIFADWLAPYSFEIQNLPMANTPPSAEHWLGTDEFGRDVLSRIIHGARTSLKVSVAAISVSVCVGMFLGAMSGYLGGTFDRIVTAVVDLTWSFPEILIALIFVAIVGAGMYSTMMAIGIAYLAQFTRLTRAQILSLKNETYVEATVSLGARPLHIVFAHLLPNALPPIIVAAMLATGDGIILEATLGFFGLGAQPPIPSWGGMMSNGTAQMFTAPWIIVFPGLMVALSVIAINMLGDSLIRALDIRSQVRTA